jgi:hypothetical protein
MMFIGLLALVPLAGVFAQNGPFVPDAGLVPIPVTDGGIGQSEPLIGAATGYSSPSYSSKYTPRSQGNYGGNYDSGYGNSNYESGYGGNGGCYGRPAGMYGDASYDCKTFQVCQADGRLDTLYCPPYTRFNNYLGVCDWHFKVDSYCNPLYKEEYNNNYDSGYGNNNYNSNNNNNNYAQPAISYEKPYSSGNSYSGNSYGGNSYGGNSYSGGGNYNSYGSGSSNYNSGYKSAAPVYNLQGSSYGQGQASKY